VRERRADEQAEWSTERRADERAEWSTADREALVGVARGAREEASATMGTADREALVGSPAERGRRRARP